MVAKRKKAPPRRTYPLKLNGELAGFNVVMGSATGRDLIRIKRGEADEADILELVAARCIEHDFDVEGLADLDFWIVAEILEAWMGALNETAVPKETATS
jgi:hypothetical protein